VILNKAPNGKFCGDSALLSAWLPELLRRIHWDNGRALIFALEQIVKWCHSRAGRRAADAAEAFSDGVWLDPVARFRDCLADGERWLKRAKAIQDCIEALKTV